MKNFLIIIIFAILLASLGGADTKAGEQNRNNSSLISRDLLFGNPDRITTRISPDGSKLAFWPRKMECSMFGWDRQIRRRRQSL